MTRRQITPGTVFRAVYPESIGLRWMVVSPVFVLQKHLWFGGHEVFLAVEDDNDDAHVFAVHAWATDDVRVLHDASKTRGRK